MKKALLAVLVGVFSAVAIPVASAGATAPYCGITWGSLPKAAGNLTSAQVTNVRTGQDGCYDRMVVDLNGPANGYNVQYVTDVYAEGSGQLIPLQGGAKLNIVVKNPAYDPSGHATYSGIVGQPLPGVNVAGYQTFREAKFAGSFEGQTTIGLGVRARLPFRVFTLGNRLVIDVANYW
ncbi:MAG TPA: hypothetical protein VJR27_01670 [Candidatus Saccharimonadales bacterium]|nr:hypothetical protein [Candidatus Saccharimonadales bacterium]